MKVYVFRDENFNFQNIIEFHKQMQKADEHSGPRGRRKHFIGDNRNKTFETTRYK